MPVDAWCGRISRSGPKRPTAAAARGCPTPRRPSPLSRHEPRGFAAGTSDARKGLQDHPTVKPTAMLQDALIDLTNGGEIVLDPFLGSGSTAYRRREYRAGVCRGIELDPLYVDVIIRRYEAETGAAVV